MSGSMDLRGVSGSLLRLAGNAMLCAYYSKNPRLLRGIIPPLLLASYTVKFVAL
jgi:hypothetical protein